ncbi:MBL fold metallo-hydrolase [Deinococcus yavapaiensis]|uniref:Glyoxylase-like metal-dependent hydrolase (Beta-lactamase superfamily II) n=1 Tax=Deinococcus yavapaiensis KR-236 TaxID=694435 RepID=A0A318SHD3_9DEIO|nr:MBL fold metallo-hydrolase [Deinococcus yavapaiensis]PYE53338.1 glyoxylase-like metal-dependent hydrolase (beta-lactamase superfamily II) [Deinococcus yavapaiensis KR-236]
MIRPVDLQFQGLAGVISSYVIESEDGPIVVDPGPSRTLNRLEEALGESGAHLSDVRHVLLTHIHLDHAGAAGTISERSGARVYVHARGAAHLSRPDRLLASASQIYGEHMDALWGEMRPIPGDRLEVLSGGESLDVGGLSFTAHDSPGHAVHHLAWQLGEDLFCGDVGGIRLTKPMTPRAPTPPPDIDLEAWRASVARLRALDVSKLHLAHFGSYGGARAAVQEHWDGLLRAMNVDADRVREGLARGDDLSVVTDDFTAALTRDLDTEQPGLGGRMRFASPAWMSVQGLARYWRKKEVRS